MRERALRDLDQLADPQLFDTLTEGLAHILTNAGEYYADSEYIAERQRSPSYGVLRAIAEEEAAKYLILLDAVRCPRKDHHIFARQLRYFYDHCARGIYAEPTLTLGQPPTFADLCRIVDETRQSLFLDGPDGDNYIYRNRILERREARMYVDYEEAEGKHYWSAPRHHDPRLPLTLHGCPPPALEIARAFHKTGLASPVGLALVASKWQSVSMTPSFSANELRRLNQDTFELALSHGLATSATQGSLRLLIDRWQYPMYSLDLTLLKVLEADLESRRLQSYLRQFDPDVF